MVMHSNESSRRKFLAYLAASPLLFQAWEEAAASQAVPPPAGAGDVLSGMEFEPAARAAKASNSLQVLSTQTSTAVEDVAKARGTAPWYQLYLPQKWEDTEKLVKRVEAAGCPVLVWTVDNLPGRNLETATRLRREDGRDCTV